MFIVILFIFLGILSGFFCRKLSTGACISLTDVVAQWQGRIVTWLIWLLLFLLGIEVGSNEMIVRSLPTLGVEALLLSSAATLGCCVLAWALWRVSKDHTAQENAKKETLETLTEEISSDKKSSAEEETSADKEGKPAENKGLQGSSLLRGLKVMKGSLIVVGFFVIGLLGGIEKMVPAWLLNGEVSFVALCGLLLFVGLGIGLNPEMKKEVRSLSPRMALLPVVTIIGSWLGALLIWNSASPHPVRLHGDKQRFRLLFAVEYLHHRISWCRIGNHCSLGKHHTRDAYPVGRSADGPLVWPAGTYLCRRSHHDGHHLAHSLADCGSALCSSEYLPWFCGRLHCALPRQLVVYDLMLKNLRK